MIDLLPLIQEDIPHLSSLQPPEWNDIRTVFNAHMGRSYFYGVKALSEGQLVGVGELMICGDSAWLGNIIVHRDHRKMGFGRKITEHLIKKTRETGISDLYLLATEMGAPLYATSGFKTAGFYNFYQYSSTALVTADNSRIMHVRQQHVEGIFSLDRRATGEDRSLILKCFLDDAVLTLNKRNKVVAFYIPKLGDGLIISDDIDAGLNLLRYRYMQGLTYLVIPEENIDIMDKAGIPYTKLGRRAVLMNIGTFKTWHPTLIFSRVGGYLG
jgi:N-acetylglutamate synthase-like GNAT family acetyltransferase